MAPTGGPGPELVQPGGGGPVAQGRGGVLPGAGEGRLLHRQGGQYMKLTHR